MTDANGKATTQLIIQVLGIVAAIATPLILMYSKINSIKVQMTERLQEVETQFKAADEFRNINLAGQMRFNALLWQQAYGQPFPQEVYFPEISKRTK